MYYLTSFTRIIVLLQTLLLSACTSTLKESQWLDELLLEYPKEHYLSAVGEAGDRETADRRARANLSQIFQVAIKDTSLDFSQANVSSINGQAAVENKLIASRFVNTEARHVLEGTQIVKYWIDAKGKTCSFVVLEKAPANRRFRESIRQTDKKTASLVEYATDKAPNPVAALRALERARLSQLQRDNTNRNLTVTAGKGIKVRYSSVELESTILQALASLQFALDGNSDQIKADIESAIASLGIQYNPQAPFLLVGQLDTKPLEKKQGWYWLRGSVELRLEREGETIAKQRWPLKVSALDQGMVAQRAKDHLSNKLSAYLYKMLTTENSY